MKHFILWISLCLLLPSCVTPVELHNKDHLSTSVTKKKWEKSVSTFFFGFFTPKKNVKVWNKCQTNNYSIKITRPLSYIISALFTLGIYTPLKIIVTCYKEPENKKDDDLNDFQIFNE